MILNDGVEVLNSGSAQTALGTNSSYRTDGRSKAEKAGAKIHFRRSDPVPSFRLASDDAHPSSNIGR